MLRRSGHRLTPLRRTVCARLIIPQIKQITFGNYWQLNEPIYKTFLRRGRSCKPSEFPGLQTDLWKPRERCRRDYPTSGVRYKRQRKPFGDWWSQMKIDILGLPLCPCPPNPNPSPHRPVRTTHLFTGLFIEPSIAPRLENNRKLSCFTSIVV